MHLSCNSWNYLSEQQTILQYKTGVCGETNYCFIVTEARDFSLHKVSSFIRNVWLLISVNGMTHYIHFELWHTELVLFNGWFAMVSNGLGWLDQESKTFPLLQNILPVNLHAEKVCIIVPWPSSSSVSLFPFLCWYMSFFQTLLLRMSLMLAKE